MKQFCTALKKECCVSESLKGYRAEGKRIKIILFYILTSFFDVMTILDDEIETYNSME